MLISDLSIIRGTRGSKYSNVHELLIVSDSQIPSREFYFKNVNPIVSQFQKYYSLELPTTLGSDPLVQKSPPIATIQGWLNFFLIKIY